MFYQLIVLADSALYDAFHSFNTTFGNEKILLKPVFMGL